MSNIKLDQVRFSSFHESFKNRQKLSASVTVSGSITGGSHKTFSTDVSIQRGSAVFEIYSKLGSNPRRRADNTPVLQDVVWSHNVYLWISQPSTSLLRITVDVDNPGATASIATQTVDFVIYVFDTPF